MTTTTTSLYCLGDWAKFQSAPTGRRRGRPRGSKNKNRLWGDTRTVVDKTLYGAGGGLATAAVLPFRSKRLDNAMRSKAIGRIPLVGRGIRNMALEMPATSKGAFIAGNPAAMTAVGLTTGLAGAAYGLNKVRQDRRRLRLARQRRRG